ncbi:hypothetical protein, conserved [Eimeria acervulina]|uniref:Uncharacterized protein n=1 Tax=Eimeria acervulina TaxID=5801 RepID=U6GFX4_EIMAC|nr:hypothetical protein, conserved [Eimeria acervulina]CDI79136.1 hypothetical protein, conserved [Eimeria acervulina]
MQRERVEGLQLLLRSCYRVCVDAANGLLLLPPAALLQGASIPLLPAALLQSSLAAATLQLQLAFRAAPLFKAIKAWQGYTPQGAATPAAAAAAAAQPAAAAWGGASCLTEETLALMLLPSMQRPLERQLQQLLFDAFQQTTVNSTAAAAAVAPFAPAVSVRSLRLLRQLPTTAAAAAATKAAERQKHKCAADKEEDLLLVADLQIHNLAAAAAAATSTQITSSTDAAAAATLDSLPAEWRVDGVLLLLQQLWRGLAADWAESQRAADLLLGGPAAAASSSSSSSNNSSCGCPSWRFPLGAFLSWKYGFGGLSISSSSSSSNCMGLSDLQSSDPSSLVIVGLADCTYSRGGAVAAFAAKPAPKVQLLQHGTPLAAVQVIDTAAAAASTRQFRLLAHAACTGTTSTWQQQQQQLLLQQPQQQWVDAEELSLPRCPALKAGGSLLVSFRLQTLTRVGPAANAYHQQQQHQQQLQQEWRELAFVSPFFNSRLSLSCRLSDSVLGLLYKIHTQFLPLQEQQQQQQQQLDNGGLQHPSAAPVCAVRERKRLTVQEVQQVLQQQQQQQQQQQHLLDEASVAPECRQLLQRSNIEGSNKRASGALLLLSFSRPSSALALRMEQQHQQQQQQVQQQVQQEVFWMQCVRWPAAIPLRLLHDEETPDLLLAADGLLPAAAAAADALVHIKPAVQTLKFSLPSSSSNSSSGDRLVAVASNRSSSSSKWPLLLHLFPVLSDSLPTIKVSNSAFVVETKRQGPLLTLSIRPSLPADKAAAAAGAVAAAAAADGSSTVLLDWVAPGLTEIAIEDAEGNARLLVVLQSSAVRPPHKSAATAAASGAAAAGEEEEGEEEAPKFLETAAPPLLLFAAVLCIGGISLWFCCCSVNSSGPLPAAAAAAAGAAAAKVHRSSPAEEMKSVSSLRLSQSSVRARKGMAMETPSAAAAAAAAAAAYTLQPNGDWRPQRQQLTSTEDGLPAVDVSSVRFYKN